MDRDELRQAYSRDPMLKRYVTPEDLAEMPRWSDTAPMHFLATGFSLPNPAGERHPVARSGQREPLDPQLRVWVLMRDRFTCQFCHATNTEFEVDHIIPWSAGGSDDATNLRTLCKPCNQDRSNRRDVGVARPLPIRNCNACANMPEAGSTENAWCPLCRRVAVTNVVVNGRTILPAWSPLRQSCDWCSADVDQPCTRSGRKPGQRVRIRDFHESRLAKAFRGAT